MEHVNIDRRVGTFHCAGAGIQCSRANRFKSSVPLQPIKRLGSGITLALVLYWNLRGALKGDCSSSCLSF